MYYQIAKRYSQILLSNWIYNVATDKINLQADTEKMNMEIKRLEDIKSKIDIMITIFPSAGLLFK